MPVMIRFAVAAMMLLAACEKTPSKLEGNTKGGAAESADTAELEGALSSLEERIKALEATHGKGAFDAAGTGDASMTARLAKVEANLARREEALGFLEMAYTQQKRQQEAQEAQEPDPNAVFAVDISKALAAGQVDGPNSALVTIVEAWDFA
jgi:hypothetical protein